MNIESIFIYLSTFGLSALCIYLSEHYKCKKALRQLFACIGVFIVCLLAGLRSTNVGTDYGFYLLKNYNYASDCGLSFFDYYRTIPVDNEILFALLIYITSKIGSLPICCFVIELLITCPVVYVLKKQRWNISVTTGYLMFLFLFYNFSLSGMRASISMSFLLLAYYFWDINNNKRAIIASVIAVLFQSATVFILVIVACMYYIEKSRKQKRILMRISFFVGLILILLLFNKLALYIIPVVNIVNPRYGNYIQMFLVQMSGFNASNLYASDLLFKTLIVIVTYLFVKNKIHFKDKIIAYFGLCLVGRYFVLLNGVFGESMRIAFYFDYFIIMFTSCIGKGFGRSGSKLIMKLSILTIAFLYWIYYIMIIGGYGTNAYSLFY